MPACIFTCTTADLLGRGSCAWRSWILTLYWPGPSLFSFGKRLLYQPPRYLVVIYSGFSVACYDKHLDLANHSPKNRERYINRSEERRVGKECRSRWSP